MAGHAPCKYCSAYHVTNICCFAAFAKNEKLSDVCVGMAVLLAGNHVRDDSDALPWIAEQRHLLVESRGERKLHVSDQPDQTIPGKSV